jgi:pimeloyl-ACP methyl ester carboxylesterase
MKTLWKILLGLVVVIVVLVIASAVTLFVLSPGKTPPIKDASGNVLPNSIATTEYADIGGMPQWMLMRGHDAGNPVILMLHGGPGTAQTHMFRYYNQPLEEHFVVVNWEQRGAGKSYSDDIPPESMTIEQFIADTHEVTQYLKQRFQQDKIYLLGHSWGSHLGLRTVSQYPEDYAAYIGIGQSISQIKSEEISYQIVLEKARAANNSKAVEELEAAGPPVNGSYPGGTETMIKLRKWWRAFGGATYDADALLTTMFKPLLLCREYTISDKFGYFKGEQFSVGHLAEPMMQFDIMQEIPELQAPAYFLQGRHDLQTVYVLVEEYVNKLKAPKKVLIPFEQSAHFLPYEEVDKFNDVLINTVLKETAQNL